MIDTLSISFVTSDGGGGEVDGGGMRGDASDAMPRRGRCADTQAGRAGRAGGCDGGSVAAWRQKRAPCETHKARHGRSVGKPPGAGAAGRMITRATNPPRGR